MGAFHQYEKQMIVLKLRVARQRKKAKSGNCEGRKPYGFHPGESDTLKRIKQLDAAGMRATDIAKTLDLEGRSTRNGGKWLQPTVSKILNRKKRSDKKES